LADIFYSRYKWVFRSIGLIALIVAYVVYLRGRGICTFDEAKKKRNEIINKFLLILAAGIIGYMFFLYVVVHYIGVFLKIWQ
jgi:bacteriorhodopsin